MASVREEFSSVARLHAVLKEVDAAGTMVARNFMRTSSIVANGDSNNEEFYLCPSRQIYVKASSRIPVFMSPGNGFQASRSSHHLPIPNINGGIAVVERGEHGCVEKSQVAAWLGLRRLGININSVPECSARVGQYRFA